MERNFILNTKCSILFLFITIKLAGQNYFATNLEYGNFNIGYDIIKTIDLGRPTLNGTSTEVGRAMTLNVWYPAKASKKLQKMVFKDYITPEGIKNLENEKKYLLDRVAELSGDTVNFFLAANDILNSETKVEFKAPIVEGKLFMIFFPDLPYGQSIMCEYLASHGYLVVSPTIQGSFNKAIEYNVRGIETGVDDLEFSLAFVRSNYKVQQSFAVMGLGFNASITLAHFMRNTDIACYISLEGGITTKFENNLIEKSPYFDIKLCNRPMLIINAPHPDVDTKLTLKYKYAKKVYQHFFHSSEFYFLNYGIWEKQITNIFPKANKGKTWVSFESACLTTKYFLDLNLQGLKENSKHFVTSSSDLYEMKIIEACELPLEDAKIFDLIEKKGMNYLIPYLEEKMLCDPKYISFNTYFQIGNKLMEMNKYSELLAWGHMFNQSFQASAIPHILLGKSYLAQENKNISKEHFKLALSLLENDDELNSNEKIYYYEHLLSLLEKTD